MNDISEIDPLVDNLLKAMDHIHIAHVQSDFHKYDSSIWYSINEIKFHMNNLLHSLKDIR